MARGRFIVVDGLDGCGKGVIIDTLVEEAIKEGKKVFNVDQFWGKKTNKYPILSKLLGYVGLKVPSWEKVIGFHPDPKKIIGKYDVIVTSEPTFVGIGAVVRDDLIAKNGITYSPEAVADGYALDRRILYEQLLLPILEAGIDVYQSRSLSTSIVYQRQMALDLGRDFSMEEILQLPGNAFCYEHPMDFLVIPTIKDVSEVMRRLECREKDDD